MKRKTKTLPIVSTLCLLGAMLVPSIAQAGEPFSWNGSNWVSADGETPIYGAKCKGVDVSFYDHEIDWEAVKNDGISFALIRVYHKGEGAGKESGVDEDVYWEYNASECERLGIPYGAYCYSEARTVAEAEAEADAVIELLKGHTLSYPVYFDMEDPGLDDVANRTLLAQMANAFTTRMKAAGYQTGFYANLRWRNNFLTDPFFDSLDFWLAEWTHDDKPIYTYDGDFDIWQACGDDFYYVDGIGLADINFDFRPNAPAPNLTVGIPRNAEPGTMFRLYNAYTGEHLYTSGYEEATQAVHAGWIYEGIAWIAPTTSSTPVYRLYNPYSGDHHYTTGAEERDALTALGWIDEGVGWYSDDNQAVPLYRQFNPYESIGAHNYTTSREENDFLASIGWIAEGIAWYGIG